MNNSLPKQVISCYLHAALSRLHRKCEKVHFPLICVFDCVKFWTFLTQILWLWSARWRPFLEL